MLRRPVTWCLSDVVRPLRVWCLLLSRSAVPSRSVGEVGAAELALVLGLVIRSAVGGLVWSVRHRLTLLGRLCIALLLGSVWKAAYMCLRKQWLREMTSKAFVKLLSRLLRVVRTLILKLPAGLLSTMMPGLVTSS